MKSHEAGERVRSFFFIFWMASLGSYDTKVQGWYSQSQHRDILSKMTEIRTPRNRGQRQDIQKNETTKANIPKMDIKGHDKQTDTKEEE